MDSVDGNSVKAILDDGLVFDYGQDEDLEKYYEFKEMERYLGFQDKKDELAEEGNSLPFETLAQKMTNVTPDGKIKKKIINEGHSLVPEKSKVFIHFSCYLDLCPVPFESTKKKSKKPIPVILDSGTIYPGFEISLKTMMTGERSQFLVHPDYAFGEVGASPDIPPNSTLLLEIHLIKHTKNDQKPDNKSEFNYIYEKAKNIHQNGNSLFSQGVYKEAIINYKRAAKMMTECRMDNDREERLMKEFLVKIYSNLMIAHNKINLPKKVCTYAWEALYTFPGLASRHVKINYNLGKAQMALHNFHLSRVFLNKARRFSNSPEIIQALSDLDKEIEKSKVASSEFLDEAFVKKPQVDTEMVKAQKEVENLINNNGILVLPHNIDRRILEAYIKLSQQHNLIMVQNSDGDWIIGSDTEETKESEETAVETEESEETAVETRESEETAVETKESEETAVERVPKEEIKETAESGVPTNEEAEDELLQMVRAMLEIIDEDDPLILPLDHNKEELDVIIKLAHQKNLKVTKEDNNLIIKSA